jgi:DNA topoisomerase IB
MSLSENPPVCNLGAMSPELRERYETQKKRIIGAIQEIEALPTGYAFRLASEDGMILSVAEFIEGERRCCPFYAFHLEIAPNYEEIWLCVTGTEETKNFIREAFLAE